MTSPSAASAPARTKPSAYAKFDALAPVYGPRLMKDVGFRDFHAAACLGNAGHESGGMAIMQEIAPRGGRGGWGWFQWTGPRRVAFESFCKAHGHKLDDDEAQYQFLLIELRGPEARSLRNTKLTTTLEAATETFCLLFERPGVLALKNRVTWANRALPLIRQAVAHAETPAGEPAPVLPPKLPEPTVTPPPVPEKPDSAWSAGVANMRDVFGPAPRRRA